MTKQIRKFAFLPSYYEAAVQLPKEKRMEFLDALCMYGWTGEVPEISDPMVKALFCMAQPAIDKSSEYLEKKAIAGKKGGENKAKSSKLVAKGKQNASTIVANAKQTCSKRVANAKQNASLINNKYKIINNKYKYNQSEETSQIDVDLFGNSLEADKNKHCNFYLWCFNRLTKRHFKWTKERQALYERRLKTFSPEDLITSCYIMNNLEFYLGKNDKNWFATPSWHLANNENINRFLESEDEPEYRQLAKEAFAKWHEFEEETGGQNV